jgi:HK97 family phage prohead protease
VIPTDSDGVARRSCSFEVRAAGEPAAREFEGIGVPYSDETEIFPGFREAFDPGSVEGAEDALILWRHDEPIGRVVSARDTDAGVHLRGRLADTAQGRDAYELLRAGVIDRLSIGFEPLEHRQTEDGLIVHTRVRAREFSLVPFPAYDNAKVSGVRSRAGAANHHHHTEGQTMEPTTLDAAEVRAELEALTQRTEDQTRQIARLEAERDGGPAVRVPCQSIGQFVRAMVNGDSQAVEFYRAFTSGVAGATTADAAVRDSWIGAFIKLATERRRILNLFSTGALPATGMNVEFTRLGTDTTAVAKQAAQGDDLAFGKITLVPDTAPVDTYGGWSALSIQAVQRASEPYLETLWQALALRYGRTTEAAARAFLKSLVDAKIADTDPDASLELINAWGANEITDALVDAADIMDTRGYELSGLLVSKDVFKKLAKLETAGGDRIMGVIGSGANQMGSLRLEALSGSLSNTPVYMWPGAAANTATFYDPVAMKTLENPGAPLRLQDDNVVNLTKDVSLYGYMSSIDPHPGALVPLEIAAV